MRSFTLVELIIVVIIIGILATFAMPAFRVTQERALDNEAKANLKLIQAAQKIYRMEMGSYYPPSGSTSDIATINQNLKLSLTATNWTYSVDLSGTATAARVSGAARTWTLLIAGQEPTCSGACPQ